MVDSRKNVLWIVNMVMPDLAKHIGIKTGVSGTWMIDLSKRLVDERRCKLAIACVYGDRFNKYEVDGIIYYTLPGKPYNMYFYTAKYENLWEKINEDFLPDIVHLHGTEYSHGLSFLRACPAVPAVLTIQGIMCKISGAAFDGISLKEAFFSNTLQEWFRFNGMFFNNILRKKNLKYEREIIQRVKYATGRTEWDRAILMNMNPKIKYYRVQYNLRKQFYFCNKWSLKTIEKHTIYASTSAQNVLKGGHIVLKALSILKYHYPDVKAYFLLPNTKNNKFTVNNGYGKIIKKLIETYNLENNIVFIPPQDVDGVIRNMLKCHCAVIPSAMENASATLREAMHLGVPCLAAYRGGMAELIKENEDGFLYDYNEYEVLAMKICKVFEDDELAEKISKGAILKAERWHDREKNPRDMDSVYQNILKEGF